MFTGPDAFSTSFDADGADSAPFPDPGHRDSFPDPADGTSAAGWDPLSKDPFTRGFSADTVPGTWVENGIVTDDAYPAWQDFSLPDPPGGAIMESDSTTYSTPDWGMDAIAASERNQVPHTLTTAQESRLRALDHTISDHLTEEDFSGALRDLQGNPVPNGKGGYFDHLGEVKNAYQSLQKITRALEGSLKNPNLSEADRKILQAGLDRANEYIQRTEQLFEPFGGI